VSQLVGYQVNVGRVVVDVVMCSNNVPNLSEIDRSAAELLMIYYSFLSVFTGCPRNGINVLKRAWTDLNQICPIVSVAQS